MAGLGRIAEFHHVSGATVALLFNFDIAQHKLKLEHQTWLIKNVLDLLRSGGSLWIMGLTSTTGPESFNSPLSQRRAESVVAFLRGKLSKDFPVKLDASVGLGELPARIAGVPNNTEDENWRAVVVSAWNRPVPPPPPPPPPPSPQEECKRLVISVDNGVNNYVFIEGSGFVKQVFKVKASPEYIKCATDFELKWSFLRKGNPSHPVVIRAPGDPGIGDVVGEVVGHYFPRMARINIVAEKNALRRLPKPYYAGREEFNIYALPVEGLLNGYIYDEEDNFKMKVFPRVPLYLSSYEDPRYYRISQSREGSEGYTIVTDLVGQIVSVSSPLPSSYPKSDSSLRIGVKTIIRQGIKQVIKTIIL